MKKIIVLGFIILLFSGCNLSKTNNTTFKNSHTVLNILDNLTDIEMPVFENPIKIALYKGNNESYSKIDTFYSKMESLKDIGLFSIILSQEEKVEGNNIKGLYKEYSTNYENFSDYKIGYNISFQLENGTTINETILKPLNVYSYSFSEYLYVWFYDDINNSGFYSHIEEDEYFENTVMTSIKLMSIPKSSSIISPIEITVFVYLADEIKNNQYIGNNKYKMLIMRDDV